MSGTHALQLNGIQLDSVLTALRDSTFSGAYKITRSATLVIAANDSSAKSKAQADYVCDGTNDESEIQAAVTALGTTGGTIKLLAGTFSAQALPIKSKVFYEGMGAGATKIQLPTGATSHLFLTSGATDITGGAIRNIELDGTNAATQNAIDFSSSDVLEEFYIENCFIHHFNHAYHGSQNDRYCPIVNNRIWYNTCGIYIVNNHPNIGMNDIRLNGVGVGGNLYDIQFVGTKINYNTVAGVSPLDGGSVAYCSFIGCHFGQNVTGLILTSHNIVDGCLFIGSNNNDIGIAIQGSSNKITSSKFRSDAVVKKFGIAAISFVDGYDGSATMITNNDFILPSGDVIIAGTGDGYRININISNNIFLIGGHAINFPNTNSTYPLLYHIINANNIQFSGNISTDPIINIPNAVAGGLITNNVIYGMTGCTVGAAISVDARSAIISLNKIRRSTGIATTQTDSNTVNTNNVYIA